MEVKEESRIVFEHQENKNHDYTKIHNFETDNVDIQIVKGFAYFVSVINSNGNYSQEIQRNLRLERAAMGKLGKSGVSKEMTLETKAVAIHTLVFPMAMKRCESWTVGRADGEKKMNHLKYGVESKLYGYPGPPGRKTSGPREN